MSQALTILICSAGSRCQLIKCFREAGEELGLKLRILACDPAPGLSPACHLADESFEIPSGDEPGFLAALEEICRREKVALLLPTVDSDLLALSEGRAKLETTGAWVVISAPSVVRLARDKMHTAETLAAGGITVPHTVLLGEFMHTPGRLSWPVIAKPIAGTSSVGLIKPRLREELRPIADQGYIVQEMWRGREFTVNVYFDRSGALRCAVPHWRMETRTGVVIKARTEQVAALHEAAQKLAAILPGATGPLCFQAIVNAEGAAGVFELNARIGGGYPLTHQAGAKFVRWLLEEAAGLPLTASDYFRDGLTMLCYDTAIFI
jgi:carbamoyl-phosphate synthase large subunit